ncbi:hypothetical protein RDWZM_003649 [Blomia tropicalis]|uniref:Uncharacterized protein n=1 Tax=Blomia tropicalis TaxID=40697 RepID=A0A9Q0MFY8_BLOTA|nr:hypothetical protein RDWZM_003649 [Blomia tropicalis]
MALLREKYDKHQVIDALLEVSNNRLATKESGTPIVLGQSPNRSSTPPTSIHGSNQSSVSSSSAPYIDVLTVDSVNGNHISHDQHQQTLNRLANNGQHQNLTPQTTTSSTINNSLSTTSTSSIIYGQTSNGRSTTLSHPILTGSSINHHHHPHHAHHSSQQPQHSTRANVISGSIPPGALHFAAAAAVAAHHQTPPSSSSASSSQTSPIRSGIVPQTGATLLHHPMFNMSQFDPLNVWAHQFGRPLASNASTMSPTGPVVPNSPSSSSSPASSAPGTAIFPQQPTSPSAAAAAATFYRNYFPGIAQFTVPHSGTQQSGLPASAAGGNGPNGSSSSTNSTDLTSSAWAALTSSHINFASILSGSVNGSAASNLRAIASAANLNNNNNNSNVSSPSPEISEIKTNGSPIHGQQRSPNGSPEPLPLIARSGTPSAFRRTTKGGQLNLPLVPSSESR